MGIISSDGDMLLFYLKQEALTLVWLISFLKYESAQFLQLHHFEGESSLYLRLWIIAFVDQMIGWLMLWYIGREPSTVAILTHTVWLRVIFHSNQLWSKENVICEVWWLPTVKHQVYTTLCTFWLHRLIFALHVLTQWPSFEFFACCSNSKYAYGSTSFYA